MDINKTKAQLLDEIEALKKRVIDLEASNKEHQHIVSLLDVSEQTSTSLFQRNQLILDTTLDSYILADTDGNIMEVNGSYIDLIGYSREELMTMNIRQLEATIPPDEVERRIQKMLERGKDRFETKHKHRDGTILDLEISISILHVDEKPMVAAFMRNNTERKNAEEALRINEQRFRTIIEQAGDALFMVDFEGGIIEVNDKACENLGYTRKELLSLNMSQIDLAFYGINSAQGKEIWDRMRSGEEVYLETSHKRKDGSLLAVESSLGIVEINHQKVALGFARDITFRKKAEEELLKLNTAINNSSEVIFMTDQEGIFTFINSEFTRLYGHTEEEVLGKVSPRILKSGLVSREINESLWKALLNKQHIPASQYVNKCKDGKLVDIEGSADPIVHEDGTIIGFLGIQRDITARKRTEQIQSVLYQISNAVNTSDKLNHLLAYIQQELGSVIDTSNFYVALYDEQTDLLSFPIFVDEKDDFEPDPQGKTLPRHVISIQKPLLIQKEEIDKLKHSGEIKACETIAKVWLGVPLKIQGKVTGVLVVQSYRDRQAFNETDLRMLEFVSDQISLSIHRKIAEQNLRDALEKAKESDRLKSTFLATMSHELRTPLNAIIGFSDIMDRNLPVNEMVEYSEIINTSGNQLLGIVEDLFDITLIDTGEMRIHKKKENLSTLMEYVYEIIDVERNTMSKDHLEFKMILPSDHHTLLVDTDSVKFRQILINLLRNALKFTRKGHVHFGYTLEKDQGLPVVRFFVKDTGIGIPESKGEIIFDMFRQAEETSTRTLGGTGLGLSIAKKLSELLGGRIWFDSEEGKGTAFYFTLPYEEEAMDERKEESAKENPLVKKGDPVKKTILVVEDDEPSFQFLKVVLEKNGYHYHWAENGLQAIEYCRANSDIDLVLMDMNMPKMNGFEATKSIRQSYPRLPIIAQTAFAVAGDREKALAAGCDDYISKPINRPELLDKIKKAFSTK